MEDGPLIHMLRFARMASKNIQVPLIYELLRLLGPIKHVQPTRIKTKMSIIFFYMLTHYCRKISTAWKALVAKSKEDDVCNAYDIFLKLLELTLKKPH